MTVLSNVEKILMNVLHQGWSNFRSSVAFRDKASIEYVKLGSEIDAIKCTVVHGYLFHPVFLVWH